MRAVIQRVSEASVSIDRVVVAAIDRPGLLVLLGVTHGDGAAQVDWMARKIHGLRLLRNEQSVSDVGAPVLVVSQFTVYGEATRGRRPTWNAAAPGAMAEGLYEQVCDRLEELATPVSRGRFGADMQVSLVNDGPVTLILDTPTA